MHGSVSRPVSPRRIVEQEQSQSSPDQRAEAERPETPATIPLNEDVREVLLITHDKHSFHGVWTRGKRTRNHLKHTAARSRITGTRSWVVVQYHYPQLLPLSRAASGRSNPNFSVDQTPHDPSAHK